MSSYYGIVFPEFWTGPTGRSIQAEGGKDGQILALYLMTCRHATMIGLYRLPLDTIKHETGIGMKGLVRAFSVLARLQFSDYDGRTEHVWVREMAKFRLSLAKKSPLDADDNKVKGVQNLYDRLVENPWLEPFFDRYAKEVRLKRKRTCGVPAQPLLDVAPSKGLVRGFEGACKPVTESEAGTENRRSGKSTGAARRPVENSTGSFGLYCVIAQEARQHSHAVDQDDSISNIAAIFKSLCAQRALEYDGKLAASAIEAVMTAAAKGAA